MARIGIDCRFYSLHNGIGRYIADLVKELTILDPNNTYILFFNSDGYSDYQKYQPKTENHEIVIVNAKHYSIREQITFLIKLYSAKLNLIHFTNFNAPIFYFGKSIVTIHDLTLHFYPGNKLNKPWHRLGYYLTFWRSIKRAKKIITVSNHTKKDLINYYPKSKSKTHAIHLGVSTDFIKNKYTEPKLATTKNYLLYAGNWREHKNLPNLIKAFAILKTTYGYNGNLVLTGTARQDHNDIPGLASRLGLTENLIFTGYLDHTELPNYFHHATAYILPSLYEGFGLPALEAMQTNTPVICSNTASLPEVCQSAAQYFDPKDPEDIAKNIHEVISSKSLQEALIVAGQKNLKNFSYKKMAQQTSELYKQVL